MLKVRISLRVKSLKIDLYSQENYNQVKEQIGFLKVRNELGNMIWVDEDLQSNMVVFLRKAIS